MRLRYGLRTKLARRFEPAWSTGPGTRHGPVRHGLDTDSRNGSRAGSRAGARGVWRVGIGSAPASRRDPAAADAALPLGEDRPGGLDADEAQALGGVLDVVAPGLVADRDEDRRIGRLGPGQCAGGLVQDAGVDDHELGVVDQRRDDRRRPIPRRSRRVPARCRGAGRAASTETRTRRLDTSAGEASTGR